jgi:hypothetical protein
MCEVELPRMNDLTVVSFSGHETFPFRSAWMKKGLDAVSKDAGVFSRDAAMTVLGVGKNMVRSIRHWCLAAGMIEEYKPEPSVRRMSLRPTILGTALFPDEGWDPYLEDPATVWLLHWLIATNTERATTWFWAFSHVHEPEFTREALTAGLVRWVQTAGWKRIAETSLKRDVDCFLRTYVPSRHAQGVLEDTLDCPLTELGLLREAGDRNSFQFNRGPQRELPDAVLLYATYRFWLRRSPSSETLSLHDLTHQPGSPGRIFQIDEDSMAGRLEEFDRLTGGTVRFGHTAGLKQLYRSGELAPHAVIEAYFAEVACVA